MNIKELKEKIKDLPDDWNVNIGTYFRKIADFNPPIIDVEIEDETHSITIFSEQDKDG